eukprot:COSAG04_NODE_13002_length_624_cov_1.161905_1_plen_141_part_10
MPAPPTAEDGAGAGGSAPLNNASVSVRFTRLDTSSSSSTLYVLAVGRTGHDDVPTHTIAKAYADFVELNESLQAELQAAASANSFLIGAEELASALPPLPQKNTIGRRKAAYLAERQEQLPAFLQAACGHPLLHDSLSLSL